MKMLKLTRFSLIVTMLFGALIFNSCTEDACTTKICENGGTCFENELGVAECDCPEGYSGLDCEDAIECFNVTCPDNVTADSPVFEDNDCFCYCNDGYEGENCDSEIRSRITGVGSGGKKYKATDACNSGEYEYTVDLVPSDTGIKNFTILNFGGFDQLPANVVCEIVGVNEDGNLQFVIPKHEDTDSDGTRTIDSFQTGDTFASIGTYNDTSGTLSITWRVVFFDGEVDECTVILEPF